MALRSSKSGTPAVQHILRWLLGAGLVAASCATTAEQEIGVLEKSVAATSSTSRPIATSGSRTAELQKLEEQPLAIVTTTGVVAVVTDQTDDGWVIQTPCGATNIIEGGRPVGPVRVVIDPGHGGAAEPGTVGPAGLVEADVNLSVGERLEAWLSDRRVSSVMTRYGDHRMPIVARTDIARQVEAEALVSIHHNGADTSTIRTQPGSEVLVQFSSEPSQRLGGLLLDELRSSFRQYDIDWVGAQDAGVHYRLNVEGGDLYGILRRSTSLPAVIVEALYLTNEAEEELLGRSEVLDVEAAALGRAILRFLTTGESGSPLAGGDTISPGQIGGGGGTNNCVDPPLE